MKLTARERALLKALKEAEAWITEAIAGCEDDATTTSLPRGYPITLRRVRAAIAKVETNP